MTQKNALHQNLGTYLKKSRQEAKLTQAEVATRLGYSSPQFVSNFERGLCSPPLKNLKTIVKLYKIAPEDLIVLIMHEQEDILRKALNSNNKKKIA